MKVRKGLVFNKHTGAMIGFVDFGKVNKKHNSCAEEYPSSDQQVAEHMFDLMICLVFKPSFSFL